MTYRDDLLAVASGEDEQGAHRDALIQIEGPDRVVVDDAVIELLDKVRGAPADQLAAVLLAHGVVDRAPHDLRHEDPVRRARAAEVLGLCRVGASLPLLMRAVDDPVLEVRVAATRALGRLGEPSASATVLSAVGAGDGLPDEVAVAALEQMGVGIAGSLQTALGSSSAQARKVAAYLSGEGSFTRSRGMLRMLLVADEDPGVREAAAAALGKMGGPHDVPLLLSLTAVDQPASLRRVSAEALGRLGDTTAIDGLAELLDDPDEQVVRAAEASLRLLGHHLQQGAGPT